MAKVWGKINPADLFTKMLTSDEIEAHPGKLNVEVVLADGKNADE